MANNFGLKFIQWFGWHFPNQILESGKYLIIWSWRFFSIGFFLPRVFQPWHKDITTYGRGFDFKTWAHALSWNLISRFLGAILRIFFIIVGSNFYDCQEPPVKDRWHEIIGIDS